MTIDKSNQEIIDNLFDALEKELIKLNLIKG